MPAHPYNRTRKWWCLTCSRHRLPDRTGHAKGSCPGDPVIAAGMRVAAIRAQGFRNLAGRVPLSGSLAVLVGENNAGKSNVIDACRLLFEAEAGPRARRWITEEDFAHDGRGVRTT